MVMGDDKDRLGGFVGRGGESNELLDIRAEQLLFTAMVCPDPKSACIFLHAAITRSPTFPSVTLLLKFLSPFPMRWLNCICAEK